MKRFAVALFTGLLLLSLMPGWALAIATTVDQSNTGADEYVSGSAINAETFTAGRYGPLVVVDLFLVSSGSTVTVLVEDTEGSPAKPKDGTLASDTKAVSAPAGAWVYFILTPYYVLTPGHVYAIVVIRTGGIQMWGSTADAYPGGQAWTLRSLAWVLEPTADVGGPADWSFKTEMAAADPTPTPTPSPTPTPTPSPTRAPTHAPTLAPTPTPPPSPTASPTPTATPTSTDSPKASEVPSASVTPASSASASISGSGSGSGSGGTDMTLPILAAIIVGFMAVTGGLGFLLWRRQRNGPTQGSGPQ
jgi:hypothetical protein